METTRRNFIAGAATMGIAAMGATLFGCAPQSQAGGQDPAQAGLADGSLSWDEEADVVVVGGGGAGGAAAYAAAKEGAKVVVLESMANTAFSSTSLCGGYMTLVDSEEQREQGIEDTPDALVADLKSWGIDIDEGVVRRYGELGHDYSLILQELGVAKSTDVITKAPGSSIARTLTLDPKDHQQKLTDAAQAAGADYRFETEGTRLVVDGGKVMGVVGKSGSKEIRFRANKAVILATGGFTSCPDLLEKCMKGLSGIKSMACPAHTGLMHCAAFNLGAQFDGIPWIYANEGMHPTASDMNGYANLFVYGAVKVNANGKRYVNEGMFIGNAMTRALLDQPMKDEEYFNYQIMDQKAYDLAAKAGKPLGVFEENKGLFVQADTYEELAEKLGAPDLPAAMARYNEDMNATGVDSAFGRDVLYGQGTGAPFALDTPPFYAFANVPWLAYDPVTTFVVNADSQLLDQYGTPIEGVYAVGEIALRPTLGNVYCQGAATGAGACFGMQAGRAAAHRGE